LVKHSILFAFNTIVKQIIIYQNIFLISIQQLAVKAFLIDASQFFYFKSLNLLSTYLVRVFRAGVRKLEIEKCWYFLKVAKIAL